MYPLEHVYSLGAYEAWRKKKKGDRLDDVDLKDFRQSSRQTATDRFWDVRSWDDLRTAVSFLTLMGKRDVLYVRGQRAHFDSCLPVLFREEWSCDKHRFRLSPCNRGKYYALLRELRGDVLRVARQVGMPRTYILEHVPAAAASVLQHYELWPTQFIDVTRSFPTAVAFAEGVGDQEHAYLYVFAMPDLRGSITSDIDEHLTLSRLKAVCPPDAKRPHHQDAYLVSRFREPPGMAGPGDASWDDWQAKTDLMRRVVAKFLLRLQDGRLLGAPRLESSFLIPSFNEDVFGRRLHEALLQTVKRHAAKLA